MWMGSIANGEGSGVYGGELRGQGFAYMQETRRKREATWGMTG
jgi:hypothetical protein